MKKLLLSMMLSLVLTLSLAPIAVMADSVSVVELQDKIAREKAFITSLEKDMKAIAAKLRVEPSKTERIKLWQSYELAKQFQQDSLDLIAMYEEQLEKL